MSEVLALELFCSRRQRGAFEPDEFSRSSRRNHLQSRTN
jgi:hypothetical protein